MYYPVRHHLVQHMVSAMQRLGFTPSVTIEQRRLAVDLSEVVIKWELQRIKDQQVGAAALSRWPCLCSLCCAGGTSSQSCVLSKPDSDMDPNSSGEGVNSVSSSIKRGLSVDSAQEVKRFRTAAGAISAVSPWACPPGALRLHLRWVCPLAPPAWNVALGPGQCRSRQTVLSMETPGGPRSPEVSPPHQTRIPSCLLLPLQCGDVTDYVQKGIRRNALGREN